MTSCATHDIGYHTDLHSKPPSISEYLLDLDWEGGIAEFTRREQVGLDTLKRVFQRTPSCYGQPGGSWAPQVYPALRQWGIPVYLDAGPWVKLDGRPHRYCDVLDLLGLEALMSIGIGGGREEVSKTAGTVCRVGQSAWTYRRRDQPLCPRVRVCHPDLLGCDQLCARRRHAERRMAAGSALVRGGA